jgi:hypothetical protein
MFTAPALPLKPKSINNEKCLADELQEALVKNDQAIESEDDVFIPSSGKQIPKVYPKYSGKFLEELKTVKFNSVSKNTRAFLNSDNMYLKEDSTERSEEQKENEKSNDMSCAKERHMNTSSSGEGNNEGDGGVYIINHL